MAECGDWRTSAKARVVAAYAGLTPKEHQFGSSVRGQSRLSQIGSDRLRQALYFTALAAQRFTPWCAPVATAGCRAANTP